MPRHCSICGHSARHTIDTALVENSPLRDIARQWRVSKDALARHKVAHLPEHLAQAHEAALVMKADALLGRFRELDEEISMIFEEARAEGDNVLALRAIAHAAKQIELQVRLLGANNKTNTRR